MNKIELRLKLKKEAIQRVKKMNFGDPITDVCSGFKGWNSYFVRYKPNNFHYVQCTDRKGKFWDIEIPFIWPGHLTPKECKKIYEPIHAADFNS